MVTLFHQSFVYKNRSTIEVMPNEAKEILSNSRMKDLTIPILLIVILFYVACVDSAMGSGEELMNNNTDSGTGEMIIWLNSSQYCIVDDGTIRVNLTDTTTLLSIIDSSEDVIMAKAVGNNSVIFTAPLNSSRCMDDNEDDQLSTTLYMTQMIIYSIIILIAIANITIHLLVKDLRTSSGILVMIMCISVIIFTFMSIGNTTHTYVDTVTVACAILINCLCGVLFVYQATKLSILYHFAYLMYQSYKLNGEEEKNIRKSVLKYIIFIIGSSFVCFSLALAIDIGVNGRIYSGLERYCSTEYDHTFLYMTIVNGEFLVFIILQFVTFAVGLTLYFLVSKKCCIMKSINVRITMALVATLGINIILLISLTLAQVSLTILVPVVTSSTLIEQLVLLALFLSSKKVLLVCKATCTQYNMQNCLCAMKQPKDHTASSQASIM